MRIVGASPFALARSSPTASGWPPCVVSLAAVPPAAVTRSHTQSAARTRSSGLPPPVEIDGMRSQSSSSLSSTSAIERPRLVGQAGEAIRELAQPRPRAYVVGLVDRLRLAQAVEVTARRAVEIRVGYQVQRRLDPLLQRARRAATSGEDHLRGHERGRVQAVDGHAVALEL